MNNDATTVAPGVTRNDHWWGYILKGSKEALIGSGLVQAAWFVEPGRRNKKGQVVRSKKQTVDVREVKTTIPAHGPCVVRLHYTDDEAKVAKRRQDVEDRSALMQPSALRKHVEDKFLMPSMCLVFHAFNLTNSPDQEWTFSPEVQERATELCKEIILLFSDSAIRPKVGVSVEGNAEFQRFILSAIGKPQQLDGNRTLQ